MKRPKKSVTIPATVGVSVLALSACAETGATGGQDGGHSPGDSITMVVPFAAGGGSDLAGRAIAAALEDITGSTITVENIVGGSGAVGYSELLGRSGDGTVLLASETSLMTLPIVQDVPFSHEDFTPIMKVAEDFNVVAVRADAPYESCMDVVDAADQVSIGVAGTSGPEFIAWSLVEADQGVSFEKVNFESGGEVVAALLGGHIDVAALNPGEVSGQLESGDARGLCVLAPERYDYEFLADVPTGAEEGIDVTFAQWRGLVAAGGISEEDRQYWIEAGQEFAETEAYETYIEANLLQSSLEYGDDFISYLDAYGADVEAVLGDG